MQARTRKRCWRALTAACVLLFLIPAWLVYKNFPQVSVGNKPETPAASIYESHERSNATGKMYYKHTGYVYRDAIAWKQALVASSYLTTPLEPCDASHSANECPNPEGYAGFRCPVPQGGFLSYRVQLSYYGIEGGGPRFVVQCWRFIRYQVSLEWLGASAAMLLVRVTTAVSLCFIGLQVLRWCMQCRVRSCRRVMDVAKLFIEGAFRRTRNRNDPAVQNEIAKQRCRFAKRFVAKAYVISVLFLAISAFTINFRLSPFWEAAHSDGRFNISLERIAKDFIGSEFLSLCGVVAVLFGLNYAISPDLLDCANVLLSVVWVWRALTVPSRWRDTSSTYTWSCRIMQGIAFGNAPLCIPLHILVTLADLSTVSFHVDQDFSIKRMSGIGYVQAQFLLTVLASVLSFSFEELSHSQANAIVEARRANSSNVLVHRLLAAMCDCVVTLDGAFCISKPSPRFASLLLRSSGSALRGQPFLQLLREDDRERFSQHMSEQIKFQSQEMDQSLAHPLHVHLLDTNGTPVLAQVFCGILEDMADNSLSYLVGIKEEESPSNFRTLEAPGSTPVFNRGSANVGRRRPGSATHSTGISEHSCSQASQDIAPSIAPKETCQEFDVPEGVPAVWLDAHSDNYDITHYNDEFGKICGMYPLCKPFRSWIADTWSKKALDDGVSDGLVLWNFAHTLNDPDINDSFSAMGDLTLHPPGLKFKGKRLQIKASCQVYARSIDKNADKPRPAACILFNCLDIKLVRVDTRVNAPTLMNADQTAPDYSLLWRNSGSIAL